MTRPLYIIIILHQTATEKPCSLQKAELYIIIILHQTATANNGASTNL